MRRRNAAAPRPSRRTRCCRGRLPCARDEATASISGEMSVATTVPPGRTCRGRERRKTRAARHVEDAGARLPAGGVAEPVGDRPEIPFGPVEPGGPPVGDARSSASSAGSLRPLVLIRLCSSRNRPLRPDPFRQIRMNILRKNCVASSCDSQISNVRHPSPTARPVRDEALRLLKQRAERRRASPRSLLSSDPELRRSRARP